MRCKIQQFLQDVNGVLSTYAYVHKVSVLITFASIYMQVHRSVPDSFRFTRAVLTIGTFDGVHKGHQRIIHQMVQAARKIDGETVMITFDPHPREVLQAGSKQVPLLNTLPEKTALLALNGLDHLVIVPFTETFAHMDAHEYVASFLIGKFHPHTIIIGYDHHFGAGRKGNYKLLENYRDQHHFMLEEIPMQVVNEINVSSTRIRESIREGNVMEAAHLLGYPYFFEGTVVQGNQMGRTIGFPTANLQIKDNNKLLPKKGVYAVTVLIESDSGLFPSQEKNGIPGMMNTGLRPTVDGTQLVTEVHLLDFNGDLYGKKIRVFLHDYLRDEHKFSGLEELRKQLEADKAETRNRLRKGVNYKY
jgi:riboflavin kinase/FMN adenylyltransferase